MLLSDSEFTRHYLSSLNEVASKDFSIPVNYEKVETLGPRASGLGDCARKSYYELAGFPKTEPENFTRHHSSVMGRFGQAMTTLVLREMGYEVYDEESTVSVADGLISGHLDGQLRGGDIPEGQHMVWDDKWRGVYGMVGTKNSKGLVTDGITYGLHTTDPGMELQMQTYILATGATEAWVLVHPFDLSALRTAGYRLKDLDVQPVYRVHVQPSEEHQKVGIARGQTLAAAVKAQLLPAREFNPVKDNFPCGYCDFRSLCMSQLNKFDIQIPPIPTEWSTPEVFADAF